MLMSELGYDIKKKYGMKILAGNEGLSDIISWVHVVEDEQIAGFLRGRELIFTTGIAHTDESWLFNFANELFEKNAAGLVINIGPYIQKIPEKLIMFGNENKFPIFSVPWETRLVDLTRYICNRIIQDERVDDNLAGMLKEMIFSPDKVQEILLKLEGNGFSTVQNCCVMAIAMDCVSTDKERQELLKNRIERNLANINAKKISFLVENTLILTVMGFSANEISQILSEIEAMEQNIKIGLSSNNDKLSDFRISYRRAMEVLRICKKRNLKHMWIDEMGLGQLLFGIEDRSILTRYVDNVLGKLISFDEENGTNYLDILRLYLNSGGSIQKVANDFYMHRNTAGYHINKIKRILDNEMDTPQRRTEIIMAFSVMDML